MRLIRFILILLAGAYANAASSEEFADLVRDLNALQNRMALGDKTARQAIVAQSQLIEKAIAKAEPDSWKEERNVRAAALYLLGGGPPRALREIYEAEFPAPELMPLLDASLRHAEGRGAVAEKALLGFEPRAYPATLGGHIALVQGGALLSADKKKALPLLDLARLLTPESLVEEAALRRAVGALDAAQDANRLLLLASRYAKTYSASPYAQSFWRTFRSKILEAAALPPGALEKYEAILSRGPHAESAELYLSLARRALLDGRLADVGAKLGQAEGVADTPAFRIRIAAYRAAVTGLTGEETPSPPAKSEGPVLPREDVEALNLAKAISARLDMAAMQMKDIAASNEADKTEPPQILSAAQRSLDKAESLLKRVTRR